jgi:D-beta-D-heptose 7-phosphate kinase/D-beta-D-heptose 1-phosphate adenosyltransferase
MGEEENSEVMGPSANFSAAPILDSQHSIFNTLPMLNTEKKILSIDAMRIKRKNLKAKKKKLVFTNGCFDILHAGHVDYLSFARSQGDALVIGLNSDISVRKIKGEQRPIVPQADRAKLLAALECVDYVVIFDENEPEKLISEIIPDILVKGEDWSHYVSGREIVEKNGGRVVLAKLVEGRSTTNIIEKIRESKQP